MYEFYRNPPPQNVQKQSRKDLKRLYDDIPATEGCLENIAKEGGCGAWCCQHQSPQVMYAEFLNTWNAVKNSWKDEQIEELLIRCVEAALDDSPTKGCVFWDAETKKCGQHQTRPFNCRIYGQTPDEEWKPRYEKLKVIYADEPKAVIRDQCDLVKSVGDKPTVKDSDQWFGELKMIERQVGVHPKLIHGEDGGTYRCYHDHILLALATRDMLARIARLKDESPEKKQWYISYLKGALKNNNGNDGKSTDSDSIS